MDSAAQPILDANQIRLDSVLECGGRNRVGCQSFAQRAVSARTHLDRRSSVRRTADGSPVLVRQINVKFAE